MKSAKGRKHVPIVKRYRRSFSLLTQACANPPHNELQSDGQSTDLFFILKQQSSGLMLTRRKRARTRAQSWQKDLDLNNLEEKRSGLNGVPC